MEDREISEELHPAEQGAAGKFSFTIIYSHYQQYKSGCISSKTSSGARISLQSKGIES